MSVVVKNRLSNARTVRILPGLYTQRDMFGLHTGGIFVPASEGIMTVKEIDYAINESYAFNPDVNLSLRAVEYAFYRKDPTAVLGKEIIWIEKGIAYKFKVEDIQVSVNGKEISLQNATGMGVVPSIGLLRIEQTGEKEFTVLGDPAVLEGKVVVVDFMRGDWALTDESGFPLRTKPADLDNSLSRYGSVRRYNYQKTATGYHGSVSRTSFFLFERSVDVDINWGDFSPSLVPVVSSLLVPGEASVKLD